MTTKDRLKAFLEHIRLSQKKFETLVGLSNGFVNNVGDSIRTDSLQKITDKFPELNTSWLITGVGEMLKSQAPFKADDPLNIERARIVVLERKLIQAMLMIYKLLGKERTYDEIADEIDFDTTVILEDLRRSGKK